MTATSDATPGHRPRFHGSARAAQRLPAVRRRLLEHREQTRSTSGSARSTASTTTTTASATTTRPCSTAPGAPRRRDHRRDAPAGDRAGRPAARPPRRHRARRPAAGRRLRPRRHQLHGPPAVRLPGRRRDDLRVPGRIRQRPGPPAGRGRPGAVPLPQHARHRFRHRIPARDLDQRDHDVRRPVPALHASSPGCCATAAATCASPAATTTSPAAAPRRSARSTSITPATSTRAASTSRRWPPTASSRSTSSTSPPETIPYWELRAQSSVATGIEEPFLTAYREGSFHYLLIAADYVGRDGGTMPRLTGAGAARPPAGWPAASGPVPGPSAAPARARRGRRRPPSPARPCWPSLPRPDILAPLPYTERDWGDASYPPLYCPEPGGSTTTSPMRSTSAWSPGRKTGI